MAKKVRTASVDASVAKLIDDGAKKDQELKNIEVELAGIRATVTRTANEKFEEGETSLRLEGNVANALATRKTSFSLEFDGDADEKAFEEAFAEGTFDSAVRASIAVNVTPERLSELKDLLDKARFSFSQSWKLDSKGYKSFKEPGGNKRALGDNVKMKDSVTVKFEV